VAVSNHAPIAVQTYADDFQVYLSSSPSSCANVEQAVQVMQDFVADIIVKSLARQHSLMLNDGKTELLVLGTRQQLSKINIRRLRVGDAIVLLPPCLCGTAHSFYKNFIMATHVTKTCRAAFFHLRNIRPIRKFSLYEAKYILIHAFVTTEVDYCESLLYPKRLLRLSITRGL